MALTNPSSRASEIHLSALLNGQNVVSELEMLFSQTDASNFDFFQFISELLESPFWAANDYKNNRLKLLCLKLSQEIELNYRKTLHEPTYHSRLHFKDVCLALTVLLGVRKDLFQAHKNWHIEKQNAWILLFSAIGHDFGHDGKLHKKPFEMEELSLNYLRRWLEDVGADKRLISEVMHDVQHIVLKTDPQYFKTLVNEITETISSPLTLDCMSALLVESDLLASALPKRGAHLGLLLSKEWENENFEAATKVKSDEGRLVFLEYIQFISPQSSQLGLDIIRKESILKIQKEIHARI